MDFSALAVTVLLGLVVLRGILVVIGAALLLRPVKECPACFAPTFMLQRKMLRRLAPFMEWRWCPHCGWRGPARRLETASPRESIRPSKPAAHPFEEPGGPRH